METDNCITSTSWDKSVFGIDTYEIKSLSEDVLSYIRNVPGHFTIKVEPLTSKKLLHTYGFYYCDTLLEPFCEATRFRSFYDEKVSVTISAELDDLLALSRSAFIHGRFHRDFNIERRLADARYENWLHQLFDSRNIIALLYEGNLAGYLGISGSKIALQAISDKYRGKGLAKYLWSAGCKELFGMGHDEIYSSVSASNVVVLNLFASLGFRFRSPLDVYQKLNIPDMKNSD